MVSRTFLFASSTEGASHNSVRSWSCPPSTRVPKSVLLVPELSTTSGGVPPLNRGCSVVEISWVLDSLTSALGNAFLYIGTCMSVAYLSLYPPAKMTTSSGAFLSTPSGLSLSLAPPPEVGVDPLLPPVAQASSSPRPGTATRLAAAVRRSIVRRSRPDLPNGLASTVSWFSGERDILSPRFLLGRTPDVSGVPGHEGLWGGASPRRGRLARWGRRAARARGPPAPPRGPRPA